VKYSVVHRVPREAAQFLRETYSMDLGPLAKGYTYLYSMDGGGIGDVWMVSSHSLLDKFDLGLFRRVGIRILRRQGRYLIPSNTFIQVFGGYMASNIVIMEDRKILREILHKTYVIIDGRGGVKEIRHTDYPYKILRYGGLSIGLVKKHSRGYISLLPRKYSEIRFL